MKIETRYSIGDELFYIDEKGNQFIVKKSIIKSISIQKEIKEKYELESWETRNSNELFKTFSDAKDEAIKKQKKRNIELLEIISKQQDDTLCRIV